MIFSLSRSNFGAAVAALRLQGVELPADTGTVSHSGVTIKYAYNGTTLEIDVLHKPFFLSEGYVESQIESWFQSVSAARQAKAAGSAALAVALVLLGLASLFPCAAAQAQGVANLYMAGGSYSAGAVPAFAGSALYAHKLNDSGTYAFTMIDALPNTTKPFTVTTNVAVGVSQRVVSIAGYAVMVPTAAGISYSGTNTGWAWSTGVGVPVPLPTKSGNWYVMPTVRVLKSSVTGQTGYQPIVGLLFGWGQ